ncbi:16S rRNA (guanine(966)-N(2))-methyltransferase RsmD [Rhodoferax sp.]|uniref:16S rRNA (guanine(966)-N(2))-methyltransferase RsmD n=1 Tax=Rhodoferax sp. TaxID=50421 RepID=UPI001ECA006E|nr:16S rRNA (guanine(966)-N(2))-methyltransferase RsmD [Rhodoferax sp.]MBT9505485.1 16S rRNA (guanine(966)-N(2))-methyltransferase RsmD [Rhodoferax sp.]
MKKQESKSPTQPAKKGATGKDASAAGARAHEVRIIGGLWKRTKLAVADKPGLRPTPDRVRETLFNWLGQDLSGWRCIDAFAGTGALGFEAASRGAKEVRLVEQDGALVAQLKRVQTQLQASATQIVRGDGVAALKHLDPASVDAVFLDPPFDSDLFEAALQAAGRTLAPGGFVYLEAPTAWTDEQLAGAGLMVYRHLKAGAVHAHLLKRLA